MSMKKWTDEELTSTRDSLEEWRERYNKSRSGSKLWMFTALLGAFAVSTGVAFIFIDGVTILSILLIVMGAFTCYSWFKSEKQKNDNDTFLADVHRELKRRSKRDAKSKSKGKGAAKTEEAVAEKTTEKVSEEATDEVTENNNEEKPEKKSKD